MACGSRSLLLLAAFAGLASSLSSKYSGPTGTPDEKAAADLASSAADAALKEGLPKPSTALEDLEGAQSEDEGKSNTVFAERVIHAKNIPFEKDPEETLEEDLWPQELAGRVNVGAAVQLKSDDMDGMKEMCPNDCFSIAHYVLCCDHGRDQLEGNKAACNTASLVLAETEPFPKRCNDFNNHRYRAPPPPMADHVNIILEPPVAKEPSLATKAWVDKTLKEMTRQSHSAVNSVIKSYYPTAERTTV